MKALLPLSCKTSIREKFLDLHNNQKHWMKETAESDFSRAECLQRQDEAYEDIAHWKAYRQLWIFAMRYFPEMTIHSSRKDVSKPKPSHQDVEKLWWYDITKLADLCGYKGIWTSYNTTYHVEIEMARTFLSAIRPAPFGFSKEESNTISEKIVRLVNSDFNASVETSVASRNYCENDIVYRCGIPFESSFK